MARLMRCCVLAVAVASSFTGGSSVFAGEAIDLSGVEDPGPNRIDEPFAETFSLDSAVRFLDEVSLTWQRDRQCFTCHTNFAYLYARPMISGGADEHDAVRKFANSLVNDRWQTEGPRWDAEVVAAAAALAFNDAATTGTLSTEARTALDRMWESQRDDGGWSWLDCGWPPFEMDDHYGVTLAALAVSIAPDDYASTPAAVAGMEGIGRYFVANPAETLHQETMRLWAACRIPDLMTDAERAACIERLWALQHEDGGWSLSSLGNWVREDGSEQTPELSDGYGTGFVMYVLRETGVAADDPRIVRGLEWLKANQRESGRWFTRSLKKDGNHFITHAGTAFAVMALVSCGE
jgi:squalene-hopene/tetraprenyl-beta-curcumene cyclase